MLGKFFYLLFCLFKYPLKEIADYLLLNIKSWKNSRQAMLSTWENICDRFGVEWWIEIKHRIKLSMISISIHK